MAKQRITRGTALVGALGVDGVTGASKPTSLKGATTSGAPLTGTWAVADMVTTQDGNVYVCTVAGTPGTWVAAINGPAGSVTTLAASGATTLAGTLVFTPQVIAALAADVTAGVVFTKSIATASTFTASTGGTAGQLIVLIISTDSTQRVATFGSNLASTGTMTIPASKVGTITFVSNGTSFYEVARAINL